MSGKRKNRYDKSVYHSFALVMQFGINMLVPICLLSALGIYLDQKFDTSYLMVILFFVGAVAGGQNVFRMARKVYEEPQENEKESGSRDEGRGDTEKGK
ncbi:MAG: AtpZ/AtpI family protein [Bacteroidales bacterium]|nr:AtpZ/AtpI family protein [Lachnoclostridium sp.]MCM1383844.1 AtpZ/AtpI family protein [Lachnoclostridium sp.]MCM1464503.1 AtpZ/AtpI family protein [Bacteroidales bacterium]